MSRFAVLPVALVLLLTAAGPVAATAPVQSTTTGTYTLSDAIFDYYEKRGFEPSHAEKEVLLNL